MSLCAQGVRALLGNLEDHKSVGDNVWEMREVFGPGWGVYCILHASAVIMRRGGCHKSNQNKDIEHA